MIVSLNGEFMETDQARIAPGDRGFTLGDGVFDTMLAVDGAPVWAHEHAARLSYHASVFEIPVTVDIAATAKALLQENKLTAGRAAIRTTVTRGPGVRGLMPPDDPRPTILMSAGPAPAKPHRVEAIIAQTVRRNEHSPLSKIKSLNYGDNLLALMEAQQQDAEDAIMLNTAGLVCCGTIGNIFIREGQILVTPPVDDGVLAGIYREKVISEQGAREETITPERLLEADAVYLTNSIMGAREIKRIDHTYFGKSAVSFPAVNQAA